MLVAVEPQDERTRLVNARHRADAERREELALVEHVSQHALEPLARRDGEQPSRAAVVGRGFHAGDVPGEVRTIGEEPVEPLLEAGQAVDRPLIEHFDRAQRQQADHRIGSAAAARVRQSRAGRSRTRPPRPTGPCRRARSSHRRWRRSARRTWRPCRRRSDPPSPVPAPSTASSSSRTPSTPCRRLAGAGDRKAAAPSG